MPRKRGVGKQPPVPFNRRLVLNHWLLGLIGVTRFDELAEHLRDPKLEGLDEKNVHRLHHALVAHFPDLPELTPEVLLEYDQNIVHHTLRLNDHRVTRGEAPITWKYFQYLALLFTEIYLDRYFRDPGELLKRLNEKVIAFNESVETTDALKPFDESEEAWPQLNKLALWCATGSGKTLLMHVNILQYQHYLAKHGRRRDLNRIILLTPNEGLSQQHLGEFEAAGIQAELFNKEGRGLYAGEAVEILDVHKLKDEMGDKTIAVDAFEGNNLVLVDEGHRGASAGVEGAWMRFRNALCEKGFSFEYSATFAQAVKGWPPLIDIYAKCILFDYSYRYFYEDGFGKDYHILNLDGETQKQNQGLYLTACLLAFFQQLRLHRERGTAFQSFSIEKPLWVFVGSSVTKTLANRDAADIVEIIRFLREYTANRATSIERIERVLNQGLVTAGGRDLFAGRFAYLNTTGLTADQLFDETLTLLFNAPGGGTLHVENLKGATGEVALRLGENDDFGVINVGDDAKLVKLCADEGIDTGEREFSGSLFLSLNESDSKVNVLIGSKKFTEGWNSWRVSTMGLMNVGATEGAQIIQLFGRGVRLKGYDRSLKRSTKVELPLGLERPKHIDVLETLAIFGVRADYMAQFRDFLLDEGLPPNEERTELLLPVIRLEEKPLKIIRLKKTINGVSTEFGDAFRKLGPVPVLGPPTDYLQKNQAAVNWYPKIHAIKSVGVHGGEGEAAPHTAHFREHHLAFLDVDALYFELERYKAERGWHNLHLTRSSIPDILKDGTWYELAIPPEELTYDSFDRVRLWQEIAGALLRKYTERYYTYRKREWELPHLEYQTLEPTDPNLLGAGEGPDDPYYRILIDESQQEIATKLKELKSEIEAGGHRHVDFKGLTTLWFDRHLYQPLLYLDSKIVEIRPTPLKPSERRFLDDLKRFWDQQKGERDGGYFDGKELHVLRNLSKGKGVGFFEAGNFHPDFIIWVNTSGKQHIIFADPKGIHNLPKQDEKVRFYETVKKLESRLGDPSVVLNSFILSSTTSHHMARQWGVSKTQMQAWHILFQDEDKEHYIQDMFDTAVT